MNYLLIIGGAALILGLYYIYLLLSDSTLSSGIQTLKSPQTTAYAKLDTAGSAKYSYQCWIYINAPIAGATNVIARGNSFQLVLTGSTLTIKRGTGGANPIIMTITQNFPIQKWTFLTINVFDPRMVEAFINGKLVSTVKPTGANAFDVTKTDDLIVGSSVDGYITQLVRKPETISSDQVWKNYLKGNGQNNVAGYFTSYNLNMSITKDDILQQNYRLFA